MTRQEARDCVARGADILDKKRPGWAERIDISSLDIACTECVLFQLGRAYGYDLGIEYTAMSSELGVCGLGPNYGFFVPDNESPSTFNPSWGYLTEAWLDAIAERVNAAPVVEWTHREKVTAS